MTGRIVCFGELLLRLTAPAGELLLQSPRLDVYPAGAEANVAVSLSRFGHRATVVGRIPRDNLGRAARDELRRNGVDVGALTYGPGRMGLYFLTLGAVLRPSEVLYDRAGSAFALAEPDSYDWDRLLEGADWLHISGVTPAVGPHPAESALRAVRTARRLGVQVSFDGNYRAKLWATWSEEGPAILKDLLSHATLGFIDERDIALILGDRFDDPDVRTRRRAAAAAAFAAFPNLERMAATIRTQGAVSQQELSALMFERGGAETETGPFVLTGVVDRIGAGDAFAAGVLHGLMTGAAPLPFGLAAAALKHSIAGDFNLVRAEDVQALVEGGGLDVKR